MIPSSLCCGSTRNEVAVRSGCDLAIVSVRKLDRVADRDLGSVVICVTRLKEVLIELFRDPVPQPESLV